MTYTHGNRPEDVVTDLRGNVQAGIPLTLHRTEAAAAGDAAPAYMATTTNLGLWPTAAAEATLWVRDPNGNVWQSEAAEYEASVDARVAAVEGDYAPKSSIGWTTPAAVNSYASLQDAATIAAADGKRLVASGTITTSSTLTLTSDADLSGLTINYTGTGTAIVVGSASAATYRKKIRLPKVTATAKTVNGWAQVSGSVGVLVQNCFNVNIYVPYVQNFETGLKIAGYGNGTSYCDIDLGHLDNNKRNIYFTADATGWANQNDIRGGRCSHNSNEGTAVSGTRHVLMDVTASIVNNNNFYGTSFESPNTVEFHLDCGGNDNYFWGCRWENTGTGARVNWAASTNGNVIHGGFGAHTIIETVGSSSQNEIRTRARSRWMGGTSTTGELVAMENTFSSTSPIMRLYEAGTALPDTGGTAWAVDVTAQKWRGKRAADTNERLIVDYLNGRIYVGAGNATTSRYFGNVGVSMGFDGANVCFITDNTYDFGVASLRPRYVRVGTAVQTGAFATGSRPSASTAGAGAMAYDTTLSKPIWSDGTVWRDATGTAV